MCFVFSRWYDGLMFCVGGGLELPAGIPRILGQALEALPSLVGIW